MNRADVHYLNCTDDNCEKIPCVDRREKDKRIAELERQLAERDGELEKVAQGLNRIKLRANGGYDGNTANAIYEMADDTVSILDKILEAK